MSAVPTTPEGCKIVEAASFVHNNLRTIADMSPSSREEVIGDMKVGRNSATWHADCEACLGHVVIRHSFKRSDNEDYVRVSLPKSCPSKPTDEAKPVLYYVNDTGAGQQ